MNAILSDNVTQKLLRARLDELITKDNLDHRKTLTLLSEKSKSFPIRMTVRMTKTSTHNNIRFMITGVEDNVVQQPLVLTTPPTNISLPSDPVDQTSTSSSKPEPSKVRGALTFNKTGKPHYSHYTYIHKTIDSFFS